MTDSGRGMGGRALQRLLGIVSMLLTGTLASSLFSFAAQLLLARLLVPEAFGRIAALLAAINFFTPVAAAGVNWFLLQAFGREGWGAMRWLRPSAVLVALTTGLSATGVGLYAMCSLDAAGPPVIAAAILILAGQVAVELASARLQLTGSFAGLPVWQSATQAGRFVVLGVAALMPAPSSTGVVVGYALVGLVTASGGALLLAGLWRRRVALSGHGADPGPSALPAPSLAQTAREAAPFAMVTMFYVLYFQGAIVILEWMRGGEAAASYNAAFLVISAIALIPNVVYMKLMMAPLCRWAVHDRPMFQAAFHVGLAAMALAGMGLFAVTAATAHWLIPLMFGPRYAGAAPVLAILALGIPVRFVQMAYSSLFISRENTARKARYLGIAALAATAASISLVPPLGIKGAAIATVFAEAVLLALHVNGAARFIDGISIGDTARPAKLRHAARHLIAQAQHFRA